jgi:hypothetical protein
MKIQLPSKERLIPGFVIALSLILFLISGYTFFINSRLLLIDGSSQGQYLCNFDYNNPTKYFEEFAKTGSEGLVFGVEFSLTELPKEVGKATSLKRLFLEDNNISSIPSEIGSLTNLEILKINNTPLDILPPEIGNLTNLKILDLRNNNFTRVPPEVGKLKQLKTLDLSGNPISETEIEEMRNLLPDTLVTF